MSTKRVTEAQYIDLFEVLCEDEDTDAEFDTSELIEHSMRLAFQAFVDSDEEGEP